MRDFTLSKYRELLTTLQNVGYVLISFEEYLTNKHLPERYVILRHDIDKRAKQAIRVAAIEKEILAKASYYFRIVKESNQPDVIQNIADWGFEIGYHYEDMAICKGDTCRARDNFITNLQYFRQFYPVQTICMHGVPQSKWDGRDLWKYADYKDYGVIGEPYFDTDFSDVLYLTDTGRQWDGYRVSVRDKIPEHQDRWTKEGWVYHTTDDIIHAARLAKLPPHIMVTTHPQRWTDNHFLWLYEFIRQTFANCIKRLIISNKK